MNRGEGGKVGKGRVGRREWAKKMRRGERGRKRKIEKISSE